MQRIPFRTLAKSRGDAKLADMVTLTISLPEALRAFLDRQARDEGYASSDEYLVALVEREQDRLRLRAALVKGAEAPVSGAADDGYFAELRALAGAEDRE